MAAHGWICIQIISGYRDIFGGLVMVKMVISWRGNDDNYNGGGIRGVQRHCWW